MSRLHREAPRTAWIAISRCAGVALGLVVIASTLFIPPAVPIRLTFSERLLKGLIPLCGAFLMILPWSRIRIGWVWWPAFIAVLAFVGALLFGGVLFSLWALHKGDSVQQVAVPIVCSLITVFAVLQLFAVWRLRFRR